MLLSKLCLTHALARRIDCHCDPVAIGNDMVMAAMAVMAILSSCRRPVVLSVCSAVIRHLASTPSHQALSCAAAIAARHARLLWYNKSPFISAGCSIAHLRGSLADNALSDSRIMSLKYTAPSSAHAPVCCGTCSVISFLEMPMPGTSSS